jgi:hypothetical protein
VTYMIRRRYYIPYNESSRYYGTEEDLHVHNVLLWVDYNEVVDGDEVIIDATQQSAGRERTDDY